MSAAAARRIALLFIGVLAAGCEYPRDAAGTLERARGGVLRVGASESPPWIVREAEGHGGIEARILRAFAEEQGARIEWVAGSESALAEALKERRIDILAAGLTREAPWKKHGAESVALVQSGERRHVLFVAQGENRLLLELDRFIVRRGRELALDAKPP